MMARSLLLALALLLAAPGSAPAAEAEGLEELVVKMATTPEQHHAIASYYRQKAEEARTEAARHQAMGKSYGGGKARAKATMQAHCEKIAAAQETLAQNYDELAALHDKEGN